MSVKFSGKVGPGNLNRDYAIPFVVYAETREEAVAKAVVLSGYREGDASVWIDSFDEQLPTL